MAAFLAADVSDMMERMCRKNMSEDFVTGSEDVVVQNQDRVDCPKTEKQLDHLIVMFALTSENSCTQISHTFKGHYDVPTGVHKPTIYSIFCVERRVESLRVA